MIYRVSVGDRDYVVDVSPAGVHVDGASIDAELVSLGAGPVHNLSIDGRVHRVVADRVGAERWTVNVDGEQLGAEAVDERTAVIREMSGAAGDRLGPRPIVAPMPGLVVRIEVEVGQSVVAGQSIVIVEAMKMENDLVAEADGIVSAVHVEPGQTVDKDQLLVDLAAPAHEGDGDEDAADEDGGAS